MIIRNRIRTSSYLLDTYPATLAYSLRQIKSGVTNVVRVRRSSDNAEQDFTAVQVTDGTLTSFCGAGDGFVSTWYGQNTPTRNLVQANNAKQPKIVSSGSLILDNGKPTIQFNGAQCLNVAYTPSRDLGMTFYAVANISTQANGVFAALCNIQTNHNNYITELLISNLAGYRTITLGFGDGSSAGVDKSPIYNTARLFNFSNKTNSTSAITSGEIRYNGQLETISSGGMLGYAGETGFTIGGRSVQNTGLLNGNMKEVIFYEANKSLAEKVAIESNINSYYSIY